MKMIYDDNGKVKALEHLNLNVTETRGGMLQEDSPTYQFYKQALGMAQDPRESSRTVWWNTGMQQMHIVADPQSNRPAQTIDGHIALYYPNLNDLRTRLSSIKTPSFTFKDVPGGESQTSTSLLKLENIQYQQPHIQVTNSNGNQFNCYQLPNGYKASAESIWERQDGPQSLGVAM